MSTTDTSDPDIRSLIAELIGSAPPAPSLPGLEGRVPLRPRPRRDRRRRPGIRSHRPVLLAAAGLVLLVVALLVFVVPVGQRPPVAAAAQLRQIADKAADQPVLRLGRNHWLMTRQVYSTSLVVTSARSRPDARPRAEVTVTDTQWSDNFGQACISSSSGPARFSSDADERAWLSTGLSDTPTGQPVASCPSFVSADATNGFASGIGAVDGSTLPRNPSALARELRTATTGIAGLDQSPPGSSGGFERAVTLLIGPVTGTTPSFDAAVYRALALLPGIDQLGPTRTQSGATGLGFSAGSGRTGRRSSSTPTPERCSRPGTSGPAPPSTTWPGSGRRTVRPTPSASPMGSVAISGRSDGSIRSVRRPSSTPAHSPPISVRRRPRRRWSPPPPDEVSPPTP